MAIMGKTTSKILPAVFVSQAGYLQKTLRRNGLRRKFFYNLLSDDDFLSVYDVDTFGRLVVLATLQVVDSSRG